MNVAFRISRRALSSAPAPAFPESAFLTVANVQERVLTVVRSMKGVPANTDVNAALVADLGFDSLKRRELSTKLSKEFCVSGEPAFSTVACAVKFYSKHPKAR